MRNRFDEMRLRYLSRCVCAFSTLLTCAEAAALTLAPHMRRRALGRRLRSRICAAGAGRRKGACAASHHVINILIDADGQLALLRHHHGQLLEDGAQLRDRFLHVLQRLGARSQVRVLRWRSQLQLQRLLLPEVPPPPGRRADALAHVRRQPARPADSQLHRPARPLPRSAGAAQHAGGGGRAEQSAPVVVHLRRGAGGGALVGSVLQALCSVCRPVPASPRRRRRGFAP